MYKRCIPFINKNLDSTDIGWMPWIYPPWATDMHIGMWYPICKLGSVVSWSFIPQSKSTGFHTQVWNKVKWVSDIPLLVWKIPCTYLFMETKYVTLYTANYSSDSYNHSYHYQLQPIFLSIRKLKYVDKMIHPYNKLPNMDAGHSTRRIHDPNTIN